MISVVVYNIYPNFPCKYFCIQWLYNQLTFLHHSSQQPSKFSTRTNQGAIEASYNVHLNTFAPCRTANDAVKITLFKDQQTEPYRYMFERLARQANGKFIQLNIIHLLTMLVSNSSTYQKIGWYIG
jgi:hypothetical protein